MDRADRPQRRLGPARPHRSARTSRRVHSSPRSVVTWGHRWAPPPLGGGAAPREARSRSGCGSEAAGRGPPPAPAVDPAPCLPLPRARDGLVGPHHRGQGVERRGVCALLSWDRRCKAPALSATPRLTCTQWARRATPSRLGRGTGRGVRTRPLGGLPAWCAQWAGRASPTRSGGGRNWTRPLRAGETLELNARSPCGAQWAYPAAPSRAGGGGGEAGRAAGEARAKLLGALALSAPVTRHEGGLYFLFCKIR